jgi:dihydroflavonol-4-reductase
LKEVEDNMHFNKKKADLVYTPPFRYKLLNSIGDGYGVKVFVNEEQRPRVTNKAVLVTGIGGFVACHILEVLLQRGYCVRGTVRSKSPQNIKHVLEIFDKYKKQNPDLTLELFEADLLLDGSFDAAVNGCEYVIHTASPFVLDVTDNQRDLVEPAVSGTLNVLRACDKFGVKKVVLTSSIAAITEAGVKTNTKPMKIYTENDYNVESSVSHNPYYYSKYMAEKEAVQFVENLKKEKGDQAFKLVILNPTLVWGPNHRKTVNQSVLIVDMALRGEFPFIFNLNWCVVDVRDVAKAHILALENENASGRYICGNETISMKYLCEVIHKHFPYMKKVPRSYMRGHVGDMLIYLDSLRRKIGLGTYIRSNIGKICFVDNSKIVSELKMTFSPMQQTIIDTVQNLIDWKLVSAPFIQSRL